MKKHVNDFRVAITLKLVMPGDIMSVSSYVAFEHVWNLFVQGDFHWLRLARRFGYTEPLDAMVEFTATWPDGECLTVLVDCGQGDGGAILAGSCLPNPVDFPCPLPHADRFPTSIVRGAFILTERTAEWAKGVQMVAHEVHGTAAFRSGWDYPDEAKLASCLLQGYMPIFNQLTGGSFNCEEN